MNKIRIGSRVRLKPFIQGHFNSDEGVKRTGKVIGYSPSRPRRDNEVIVAFDAPKREIMKNGFPRGAYLKSELKVIRKVRR